MAGLIYLISHSTAEPDRAATALHSALAAVRNGHDIVLWLSSDGVRLGIQGVAETLHEPLPESAAAMMAALAEANVPLYLEQASFDRRGYAEDALRPGAEVVGAGHLATLAAEGRTPVSL